ncbi:glycerophosphodiester phosphodiesterase family protein [Candidatus Omnitrophota bacterium]
MKNNNIIFIAHRGESHDAPENTLAAINLAWSRNDDAVEIDIQMSQDGTIVVFHDENTNRITGVNKKVHDQTYVELKNLDAGIHKGERWFHERIPTLEEVIETVPQNGKLFVEIKGANGILGEIEAILGRSHLRADQVILMDFNIRTVEKAKRIFPDRTVLWIVDLDTPVIISHDVHTLTAEAKKAGLDGLDVSACDMVNNAFTAAVREAGLLLYVWTVDDPKEAKRLMVSSVDGITSNRAFWLRESLMS